MKRLTYKVLITLVLCALAIFSDTRTTSRKPVSSGTTDVGPLATWETSTGLFLTQTLEPQHNPNFQLIWQRLVITNLPPPRMGFSLTLDSTTQRALLFGGLNSTTGDLNDLWATDGNEWTQVVPSRKPIERVGANFIYDEARQQAILFGGWHNAEYLGNTWRYAPYEWVQQIPELSPPPRADASMAYDAARETTLLFGGRNWTGQQNLLNDTWMWDGVKWEQQSPSIVPAAPHR